MPVVEQIACFRCGTCCIAPDISTLRKPLGVPCAHLRADHLCGIYPDVRHLSRPAAGVPRLSTG